MCVRTLEKMAEMGTPYVSILYAGMMWVARAVRILSIRNLPTPSPSPPCINFVPHPSRCPLRCWSSSLHFSPFLLTNVKYWSRLISMAPPISNSTAALATRRRRLSRGSERRRRLDAPPDGHLQGRRLDSDDGLSQCFWRWMVERYLKYFLLNTIQVGSCCSCIIFRSFTIVYQAGGGKVYWHNEVQTIKLNSSRE